MDNKIKPGHTFEVSDEVQKLADMFISKINEYEYGATCFMRLRENEERELLKLLEEIHLELEGYHFVYNNKTKEITVAHGGRNS